MRRMWRVWTSAMRVPGSERTRCRKRSWGCWIRRLSAKTAACGSAACAAGTAARKRTAARVWRRRMGGCPHRLDQPGGTGLDGWEPMFGKDAVYPPGIPSSCLFDAAPSSLAWVPSAP